MKGTCEEGTEEEKQKLTEAEENKPENGDKEGMKYMSYIDSITGLVGRRAIVPLLQTTRG